MQGARSAGVLKKYVARLRPSSWSGSLAAAMEAPLAPLRTLESHSNSALAEFAKKEVVRLQSEVERIRKCDASATAVMLCAGAQDAESMPDFNNTRMQNVQTPSLRSPVPARI